MPVLYDIIHISLRLMIKEQYNNVINNFSVFVIRKHFEETTSDLSLRHPGKVGAIVGKKGSLKKAEKKLINS